MGMVGMVGMVGMARRYLVEGGSGTGTVSEPGLEGYSRDRRSRNK